MELTPSGDREPFFDFSLSTSMRLAFCFEQGGDYRRQNDWNGRLKEMQQVLIELAPFCFQFDKKLGQFLERPEYTTAKAIQKKAEEALQKCTSRNMKNEEVVKPSPELIKIFDEFDIYLRCVAFQNKLYMKVDEEGDTIPLLRRPRFNSGRF